MGWFRFDLKIVSNLSKVYTNFEVSGHDPLDISHVGSGTKERGVPHKVLGRISLETWWPYSLGEIDGFDPCSTYCVPSFCPFARMEKKTKSFLFSPTTLVKLDNFAELEEIRVGEWRAGSRSSSFLFLPAHHGTLCARPDGREKKGMERN